MHIRYTLLVSSLPSPPSLIFVSPNNPLSVLSVSWILFPPFSPFLPSLRWLPFLSWSPFIVLLYTHTHFKSWFCVWEKMYGLCLSLAYFSWLNASMFHPFSCKYHDSIFLYHRIEFHCAYVQHFLSQFICFPSYLAKAAALKACGELEKQSVAQWSWT